MKKTDGTYNFLRPQFILFTCVGLIIFKNILIYSYDFSLYDMIIDIYKEVIISSVIGAGAYIFGRLPEIFRQRKKKKLRAFIGRSAKDIKSIVISVPVFHPLEELRDGRNNHRFKKIYTGNQIRSFPGPEDIMAVADIAVASDVILLLSQISQEVIEPLADEKTLELWQNHCFFCIGGTMTNYKAKQIFQEFEIPPIRWIDAPEDLYDLRLQITKNEKEFISSREEDYGVILKIPNPYSKGDFVFILAGIAHFGTIASSQYLKQNWEDLYNRSEGKPFVSIIQVDTKFIERIKEVYFDVLTN